MVQRQKTTEIGLLLIGLAFIVLGIVMAHFWESLLRIRFNKELSLHPDSIGFREWKYTNKPVIFRVTFWNWTNPDEISEQNYKPSFVEMGPYVFKHYREKVNITFNDNGTVTYRTIPYWFFDQERSNGSLSDNVTSVNVIAASASYMTKTWSRWLLYPLSVFLVTNGQKISWTKNVSQLLFEGFENPVQKIGTYVPGYDGPDKFGWMYGQNGTIIKDFLTVDTGVNNISNIGQLYSINYQNRMDTYPDCTEIKGSAAEFFSPKVDKNEPLKMYIPEFCRKMYHYYIGDSTYEGLKTYVFSGTKESMDNGSLVNDFKCYCKDNHCPPAGAFSLEKCQKGAPIFISQAHFMHADPYYRNSIEGMNPDPSKHTSFMALEPLTGIQFNVSVKMQTNVFITKSPGISIFRKVPDLYIPVFWLESESLLTGDFLEGVTTLVKLIDFGPPLWYGISALGFSFVLAVAIYHLCTHNSANIKRNLAKTQTNEKEALRKAEVQKLQTNEENVLETVKYVIPEDKAVILD